MTIDLNLPSQILNAQAKAMIEENVKEENLCGMDKEFKTQPDGTLCIRNRSWLPLFGDLRDFIMLESHKSKYSIHPGSDKMYHDIRQLHLWPNKKVDITTYVSKCLTCSQKALGTHLDMSTAYHPQTDGQSKRTIQMLEDMLHACVIDFGKGWDRHLPLLEFSYNNNSQLTGLEIIHETTEKIIQIKNQIQAARDRQKSYADIRRKPLEFQVGDKVMLKVSPWKGVIRFGKRGKLNPRYLGPFKVLAKVRPVAYRLKLPQQLSKVHSTFYVSNLKKCLFDETLIIRLEKIQIDDKLHFLKEPVEIMDQEVKRLNQSRIPIVKIVWFSHNIPRHAFHLWLVMRQGLKTHDRMKQWDVGLIIDVNSLRCSLCNAQSDSHTHLFFECAFSAKVWSYVRVLADMDLVPPVMHDIIIHLQPMGSKRTARCIFGKLIMADAAYFIWLERNNRTFKNVRRSPEEIRDIIMVTVRLKLLSLRFKNTDSVRHFLSRWKMPKNFRIYG
ncbi:putative reverse transcriptase domain-containing protein [Tanacetum coccineum]